MDLVRRILVPGLHGAEMQDAGQTLSLPAQEEALVAGSADKRRRDFALGRCCARAALEKLGHGDWVVGKAANGAPLWPQGILGSITHTQDYAAALVGEAGRFRGIGVDAERIGEVTQDLWARLFTPQERDHLMALNTTAQAVAATLIFSAKEACYKAWGGAVPLAFRDIWVRPHTTGFTAQRGNQMLYGHYAVEKDLLLAAVWF